MRKRREDLRAGKGKGIESENKSIQFEGSQRDAGN
jgi:hypothetical protein